MTNRYTGKLFAGILVIATAGLIASGCSTTDGTRTADPQKAVYAVAVALTAADNVALRYVTMPLCGPTHAKPLCSEAAVTAKIKANAQKAHDAVKAAEAAGAANSSALNGAVDAAQAAVDALVQSTPTTGA